MKQKYVLTAVAVVAVGAVALGTVPMWEGMKFCENRRRPERVLLRNPVNTETEVNRYANASSDDGPGLWNFSYGQL